MIERSVHADRRRLPKPCGAARRRASFVVEHGGGESRPIRDEFRSFPEAPMPALRSRSTWLCRLLLLIPIAGLVQG